MTHRHLVAVERQGDALDLTCPYVVEVDQDQSGIDNRNAMPWSRLFLMHPEGPAAADAVTDVLSGRRHALRPGGVLLMPAGRLYAFRFHAGMRMLAAHFRLDWAPGCDVFADHAACTVISGQAELVRRAYAGLALGEGLRTAAVLRGALLMLAGPCIGRLRVLPARLRSALERIESDCRADLAVGALAREAGLSRERFSRVFRAAVGVAPMEHVRRRLAARACGLLLEGLQVQEVAARLHFSSPFWFSRFFATRIGLPPRDFRLSVTVGT